MNKNTGRIRIDFFEDWETTKKKILRSEVKRAVILQRKQEVLSNWKRSLILCCLYEDRWIRFKRSRCRQQLPGIEGVVLLHFL